MDLLERRKYVALVGGGVLTSAGLAGCSTGPQSGDGGDTGGTVNDGDGGGEEEEYPEGVTEDVFNNGPVPDAYTTASSQGNEERNPDELLAKSEVQFAEYEEATENDAHAPGTACGNCAEYIPDKNGDGFGACAKVEGYVGIEDWCSIYESLPEPGVPEGLSEGDLATAEVPQMYRDAESQGGEARQPADELATQADVQLTESVEAAVDGPAEPGMSCGTCAEFIPDQNGDGWGACAKVEGYIAVEDYCTIWEHITEALE